MKRSVRVGFCHLLHGLFDQLFQHVKVHILNFLDVQAGFPGGVPAEPVEQCGYSGS